MFVCHFCDTYIAIVTSERVLRPMHSHFEIFLPYSNFGSSVRTICFLFFEGFWLKKVFFTSLIIIINYPLILTSKLNDSIEKFGNFHQFWNFYEIGDYEFISTLFSFWVSLLIFSSWEELLHVNISRFHHRFLILNFWTISPFSLNCLILVLLISYCDCEFIFN